MRLENTSAATLRRTDPDRAAWAVRSALGGRDFDDLPPRLQARFAQGMGVNLDDLRAALRPSDAGGSRSSSQLASERRAELDDLRAGARGGNVAVNSRTGRTTRTGSGDACDEMARDKGVWMAVRHAERVLGLGGGGRSRSERLDRVHRRFTKLRTLAIEEPERMDDRSYERLSQLRRQLRDAEAAYSERCARSMAAREAVGRQAVAVRCANRLVAG